VRHSGITAQPRRSRRWRALPAVVGAGALLAVVAPSAFATAPSDTVLPSKNGSCAPTPNILRTKPKIIPLQYGMTMRIWDTGPTNPATRSIRVVVVTIPQNSPVGFQAISTPDLSTTQTTSAQVAHHKSTLVAINAAVFNLGTASTPEGPQVVGSQVWKATSGQQDSINVGLDGKAIPGEVSLTSKWTTPRSGPSVGSLNWQTLTSGINVYTNVWGHRPHPSGGREVWVTGTVTPDIGNRVTTMTGHVSRIITSGLGHRPPANTWVFTTSSWNSGMLRAFSVGAPVTLTLGYRAYDRLGNVLWHTAGALGRGGVYIWKGANRASCFGRDENLRPRTFIGWRTTSHRSDAQQTDAFIMTVQGRSNANGVRWGGATVHQATDFMLQLGAGRAVGFDSGGSTTMLAQLKPGAPLTHIDRANPKDGQRAIINVLAVAPYPFD